MKPICIIFNRLGPYHWARLNAAGALFPTLGLELSGETTEYAWDKVDRPGTFRRVTLFPECAGRRKRPRDLVRRIHAILDEAKPSAVAIPGWWDKGALAALSWCLKTTTPAIVMSESQVFDETRRWPREEIKKHVIGMCSTGLVGGISHAYYLAVLGMPRNRIFTGYDVVDNDYFAQRSDAARRDAPGLRRRLNLPEKYFLAVNRFVAKKNLNGLLEAYRNYREFTGPAAWKLVLLGDGELKSKLLAQIKQLRVTADVLLPGFKQYDELPAYYGLAGAFVHASTIDQWGLVVNEAMACGLPVLVSDHCGCAPDLVVPGKNGFTFSPLDIPALGQLLGHLAGNECNLAAMGAASRTLIARWSPATFAANLKSAAGTAMKTPCPQGVLFNQLILRALLQR